MTHLTPGGAARSPAALVSGSRFPTAPPLGIDHERLEEAIIRRRTQIALIESEWVSICEQRAAHHASHQVRLDNRETWDRAMWNRYLAAAAETEKNYLPRLRSLYNGIARLERLRSPLPAATMPNPSRRTTTRATEETPR